MIERDVGAVSSVNSQCSHVGEDVQLIESTGGHCDVGATVFLCVQAKDVSVVSQGKCLWNEERLPVDNHASAKP